MAANILGVVVFMALAVGFAWLARRASRARFALVKWPGMVLSGLLTLVMAALAVILVIGTVRLNVAPYTYSLSDLKVEMSAAQVQRGEQLAYLCVDCHSRSGQQLPLDGGQENFLAEAPMPLGTIYVPNLTPGGPLKTWTDAEILQALREGVDRSGRPLLGMPSSAFHNLSDRDATALVAYLRSQPAVEHALPDRDLTPLTAAMVGIGLFPTSAQTPITGPVNSPQPGTPEYGQYLMASFSCADCHGADYKGGQGGFAPKGPNLPPIVSAWSQAAFVKFFRSGIDPSGRLVEDVMPWKSYGKAASDQDLADIYSYLSGLK
jgi:cytochrome c553